MTANSRLVPRPLLRHAEAHAAGHMLAEPAAAVDGADYRAALAQLAAGVTVITTIGQGGQKLGLTATAVAALSAEPPLVLASIGRWSRVLAALEAQAPFIIHMLGAEQQGLAQHFATAHADKFVGVAHSAGLGGCPRLERALAWIECVPHALYPAGDHTIVVGRVQRLALGDDEPAPLIYFRRQYRTLHAQPDA